MGAKTVQNMEELARLANVSKSTVSRALNNNPLIKQETRDRIQAIARENDFCLNQSARSLNSRIFVAGVMNRFPRRPLR